ncbi:kirola-like [Olea europaea var. sylvestris]|uniref:kirola-like n=1 Tax=Olea europaea var. sylvestris TaxID=158386 RepID=UPI000C1D6858|nr:kirola-like [Olea europaea var. sylvestris]
MWGEKGREFAAATLYTYTHIGGSQDYLYVHAYRDKRRRIGLLLLNYIIYIETEIEAAGSGFDLHEGEWGTLGSVYFWKYTHDGKQEVAKEVIESIDEEKKSMTFKVVEGDQMKLYKAFKVGFHVETHGGIDLVTCTLEYEKLNDDIEEPLLVLGFVIKLAKDVEAQHLKAT